MKFVHSDEARKTAVEAIRRWIQSGAAVERVLLITDLLGKLRLILWPKGESFKAQKDTLQHELVACGPWWEGERLILSQGDEIESALWEGAWRRHILIKNRQACECFRAIERGAHGLYRLGSHRGRLLRRGHQSWCFTPSRVEW